jgi:hypothetical protein
MKVPLLHGWHPVRGGVEPSVLAETGHEAIKPALDGGDSRAAVRTAQTEYRPIGGAGRIAAGAIAVLGPRTGPRGGRGPEHRADESAMRHGPS